MDKYFFESNGYLILPKVINFDDEFKQENQKIINSREKNLGILSYRNKSDIEIRETDQTSLTNKNCSSRYKHPLYEKIHYFLKEKIENILEKKIYPTFYFDRVYMPNSELKPHTDRNSCEISVTLHIKTNLKKPWLIYFRDYQNMEVGIDLLPGDAILYKGIDLLHWRNPLPTRHNDIYSKVRKCFNIADDTYYHQAFFHYVLSDGPNIQHSWDYYKEHISI